MVENNLKLIKTPPTGASTSAPRTFCSGRIVAEGTPPEDVAKVKESYTGRYLKDLLTRRPAKSATTRESAAE